MGERVKVSREAAYSIHEGPKCTARADTITQGKVSMMNR
tara:strand:- start:138 stop:254 length:117 start_codon:yes stop_codon:yes gene_type:complete